MNEVETSKIKLVMGKRHLGKSNIVGLHSLPYCQPSIY